MRIIIQYITTYAPYIYAVCGLFALIQIYRLWQVRAERRQAVFTLEREKAVHELYNIFSIAMILLVTMGVTYFFSRTLAVAVDPDILTRVMTATPSVSIASNITNTTSISDITNSLVATNTPVLVTVAPTLTPLPSPPTPTPSAPKPPVATPASAPAPIVQQPACADERAVILRPGDNERVSGTITIIGTATHDKFNFYKIEYAPAGTQSFSYLGGGDSPVINGGLYSFNSTALGNGAWTIRLVVVDQTGNFPEPCQVTIQVQN
ncbi:hypothetical protein BH10CHL1_BH10CHL1_42910 [soil metagenome]